MISYKNPFKEFPNITVPVLHRVHYNYAAHDEHKIRAWIQNNCHAASYESPGWWHPQHFYEFEDDEDATMFALRWS